MAGINIEFRTTHLIKNKKKSFFQVLEEVIMVIDVLKNYDDSSVVGKIKSVFHELKIAYEAFGRI